MEDSFYKFKPPWTGTRNNGQIDWTVYDNIPLSPEPSAQEETAASADMFTHPLQLVRAGNKLYVRKGTVGGEIPTISGTPLDDDYLENELSWSGTSTFWLNCTVDDTDDSTTAVSITTTDPGANTTTQAKLQLGSVTMDGSNIDSFSSNLTGSQERAGCGTSHYFGVI
jgi:transglutaminase-like putative cysteine protease